MALWRLWKGALSVDDAFWTWAVLVGVAVNAATSLAFTILYSSERHLAAYIVGYGVSLPYNLIASVGVWRCGARDRRNPGRADAYRIITVIGMVILSVT